MEQTPVLVLVHGAWHGPWCWQRMVPELDGIDVRTVALPSSGPDPAGLGDLHDDAQVIRSTVTKIDGPVLVCAHTYGGAPATEGVAGLENVRRLVYLAGFLLDVGESVLSLTNGELPSLWEVHEARGYFDVREPLASLYPDVEPEFAQWAAAQLGHQSLASVTQPLSGAGWHNIPNTYVVCERDAAFPAAAQQALAGRAGSVRRLDSGHSPFFSHPVELARLLREELRRAGTPD